jgi:MurNAc alpha-1-phosphate uridylyltransferase
MNPAQLPSIILAAGRGERMRPLTNTCPKPLLPVRGKPLMQWALEALLVAGVSDVTVNTAWLEQQIQDYFNPKCLSDLHRSLQINEQIDLRFSSEGRDFGRALETAGGIARALPQIGDGATGAFWAVAGDVFAPDFAFAAQDAARFLASEQLAHLWLVPNPPHHPQGDFGISPAGLATGGPGSDDVLYTFSAIALYRRELFAPPWCDIPPSNPQGVAAPLAPLLRRVINAGRVGAQLYTGSWTDVGTPERLAQLNATMDISRPFQIQ